MSCDRRPRTFSQALLNLGRVRSVEDSIIFGLWGLHKAKEYGNLQDEEKREVNRHLTDLKDFCQSFQFLTSEESRQSSELTRFLNDHLGIETTPTVNELSAIFCLSTKEARKAQIKNVRYVRKTLTNVLCGRIISSEIEGSLLRLEEIRKTFHESIESERRHSERIISGRPLST